MNNESSEEQASSESEDQQKPYTPTAYEDASWEIVGEAPMSDQFQPLELERVDIGVRQKINPIFDDYTEKDTSKGETRWHLPPDLMQAAAKEADGGDEEDETIKMSAEELEKIRKEAYEQGLSAGQKESEEVNKQNLKVIEEKLFEAIKDLDAQLKEQVLEAEKNAINLAMAISKKIVTFAVEICPEYIEEIVEAAISKAGAAIISKVKVSPEDMEFIEIVGLNKKLTEDDTLFTFEADATIKNGCVVETSAGEIDFQLDEAWERVKENVLKVIR